MTKYYLEVLKPNISICIDSDISYYHQYEVSDVILIYMYPDKGPKVILGSNAEYDAIFTIDWNKPPSARLSIAGCLTKGYIADISINVERQDKLKKLGI